jgi:hypothetical protein
MQVAITEGPTVFFSLFVAPSLLGTYVLIKKILIQPLTIIGSSISTIMVKKFSVLKKSGSDSTKLLLTLYGINYLAGVFLYLILMLLPESFYTLLVGNKWDHFREIFLACSILTGAKLSAGVNIVFYQAFDRIQDSFIIKTTQTIVIGFVIYLSRDLDFVIIVRNIAIVEVGFEVLFSLQTLYLSHKRSSEASPA